MLEVDRRQIRGKPLPSFRIEAVPPFQKLLLSMMIETTDERRVESHSDQLRIDSSRKAPLNTPEHRHRVPDPTTHSAQAKKKV